MSFAASSTPMSIITRSLVGTNSSIPLVKGVRPTKTADMVGDFSNSDTAKWLAEKLGLGGSAGGSSGGTDGGSGGSGLKGSKADCEALVDKANKADPAHPVDPKAACAGTKYVDPDQADNTNGPVTDALAGQHIGNMLGNDLGTVLAGLGIDANKVGDMAAVDAILGGTSLDTIASLLGSGKDEKGGSAFDQMLQDLGIDPLDPGIAQLGTLGDLFAMYGEMLKDDSVQFAAIDLSPPVKLDDAWL